MINKLIEVRGNMKNWYAVYKGDEFEFMGTKEECARYLNVKPDTIYFMTTPTYKKRRENSDDHLIVIKVEEINDDEYILVDNQNKPML